MALTRWTFVCALQESIFPVLCKFWQLCGGVNGDLLQEGLCHTQVYCTQSPCPCSSPLLTHTSAGDTQTQFCLSLCGLWVLVHTRFVWALRASLAGRGFDSKCNFVPLPSCWGFSFALGRGVSFFGGIQHSSVSGFSTASCKFGVLAGE